MKSVTRLWGLTAKLTFLSCSPDFVWYTWILLLHRRTSWNLQELLFPIPVPWGGYQMGRKSLHTRCSHAPHAVCVITQPERPCWHTTKADADCCAAKKTRHCCRHAPNTIRLLIVNFSEKKNEVDM